MCMNLKELQRISVETTRRYDKKMKMQHNAEITLVHLVEELGEISREIYNEKSGRDKLNKQNLEGEIADVMILVSNLAGRYDIDLEDAVKRKISELRGR